MLMAVQVQVSPVFKPGNPVKLFEARNISTLVSGSFFDVTKDGRRFIMIKELPPPPGASATPAGPSFVVVVNWLQELMAAVGE